MSDTSTPNGRLPIFRRPRSATARCSPSAHWPSGTGGNHAKISTIAIPGSRRRHRVYHEPDDVSVVESGEGGQIGHSGGHQDEPGGGRHRRPPVGNEIIGRDDRARLLSIRI